MKRIVQLVPRLPPLVDGLGDYAVELGTGLAAHHGFDVEYLVTDPAWRPAAGQQGLKVERLAQPRAMALVSQLEAMALDGPFVLLLHYVGYAYQARGCPHWLVDGLTGWRRGVARERRRLVVVFHELFATGPPWSSAFWLSFSQRQLSSRLARLADGLSTSSERYARWLARLRPEVRESTWPVLSNVGELLRLPERAGRERALVVFGLAAKRALVYRADREQLLAACAGLGITRLHDIGPWLDAGALPGIPGVEVIAHGPLPKPEVSALLARCAAGFFDNGDGALGKSGVFAAYCSHGVTPIASKRYPDEDGLVAGVHYLTPRARLDEEAAARVAAAAHAWYSGHGRPSLAAGVARLLNGKDLR